MEITIDHKLARGIAALFRQVSGQKEPVSHSAALELAAKAVGLPNWDTLSGMLKASRQETATKQRKHSLKLDKPVRVFLEVLPEDGDDDSPRWCRVLVTTEWLEQLDELAKMSKSRGRRICLGLGNETLWDNSSGYRDVSRDDVFVDDGAFQIRGEYRYSDGVPRTVMVSVARLLKALKDETYQRPDIAWQQGELFIAASNVTEFIQTVAEFADDGVTATLAEYNFV